jgi:hypothetical protein
MAGEGKWREDTSRHGNLQVEAFTAIFDTELEQCERLRFRAKTSDIHLEAQGQVALRGKRNR